MCDLRLLGGGDIPTVPSITAKSMSHVALTLPFSLDESREMTRTMATIMVIIPTVKTTPRESFCAVEIRKV